MFLESVKDRGSKGTPVACTLVVYVTDIFSLILILILGYLILDQLLIFAIRCRE
jgi:hypothetical protein